ncbi:hypothetical protein B0H13DRAFT_1873647 [Mycena leptocephala]|nr:hypothetical protein B0H13DRAFT_1873647 [Mycena leptocephala]
MGSGLKSKKSKKDERMIYAANIRTRKKIVSDDAPHDLCKEGRCVPNPRPTKLPKGIKICTAASQISALGEERKYHAYVTALRYIPRYTMRGRLYPFHPGLPHTHRHGRIFEDIAGVHPSGGKEKDSGLRRAAPLSPNRIAVCGFQQCPATQELHPHTPRLRRIPLPERNREQRHTWHFLSHQSRLLFPKVGSTWLHFAQNRTTKKRDGANVASVLHRIQKEGAHLRKGRT